MNKLPLILIGGGGHCRSCIDVINLERKYAIQGILDNNETIGAVVNGYPILGNDELINQFAEKNYFFLNTKKTYKKNITLKSCS